MPKVHRKEATTPHSSDSWGWRLFESVREGRQVLCTGLAPTLGHGNVPTVWPPHCWYHSTDLTSDMVSATHNTFLKQCSQFVYWHDDDKRNVILERRTIISKSKDGVQTFSSRGGAKQFRGIELHPSTTTPGTCSQNCLAKLYLVVMVSMGPCACPWVSGGEHMWDHDSNAL